MTPRPTLGAQGTERVRVRNDISPYIGVGPDEFIDHDTVATFGNFAGVPKSALTARPGRATSDL
jgi:hypothetical protein